MAALFKTGERFRLRFKSAMMSYFEMRIPQLKMAVAVETSVPMQLRDPCGQRIHDIGLRLTRLQSFLRGSRNWLRERVAPFLGIPEVLVLIDLPPGGVRSSR